MLARIVLIPQNLELVEDIAHDRHGIWRIVVGIAACILVVSHFKPKGKKKEVF